MFYYVILVYNLKVMGLKPWIIVGESTHIWNGTMI